MTYKEWTEILDILKTTSKKEYLNKFLNEPTNNNIIEFISPRIKNMLYDRMSHAINTIIKNLDMIFEDENLLDMELVNFRKNVITTYSLIESKNLLDPDKVELRINIKKQANETYDILEKEALNYEDDGILYTTIKNNRIKWSDK